MSRKFSCLMESNYDPLFPDHPVADQYLFTWANFCTFGDKPAFKWVDSNCNETDSITYKDLNRAASRIASHLCNRSPLSFSKGDRVLIIYPPGLDFIQILFGCQRAGLVIIPISPPDPAKCSAKDVERLGQICSEASPRAVLSPHGYSALLRKTFWTMGPNQAPSLAALEARDWIDIICETSTPTTTQPGAASSSSTPSSSRAPAAGGCGASDIFLLQYTSGTTGKPKPVLVSAGSAAHNARSARRAYDLGPATVIATWLPQYHDCGLVFTLLTVVCGATTVMAAPRDFATRPCLWLEMLSQFKATCTVVPAFALPLTAQRHLHQTPTSSFNLACLQCLILINEPILLEDVHHFQTTFSRHGLRGSAIAPSYGLAENCTFVCTAWPSPSRSGGYPSHGGLLPVGRVGDSNNNPDMDIRVVKPSLRPGSWREGEEAPEGSEGEIWVSSPSNASGYLALPSLTERTFRAQLASQSHHPTRSFVRTGDLGRIVEGFLYVTGRTQEVLLVQGRTVHPHLLERSVFRTSSGLRAGCCVAFSGSTLPEVVVVAEVVDEANWAPETAQRAWEVLHFHHGIPACAVALVKPRSIPKTTSGKLRRNQTRHLFLQNRLPLLDCTASPEIPSQQQQSRL